MVHSQNTENNIRYKTQKEDKQNKKYNTEN
jgi:hypothetical protein